MALEAGQLDLLKKTVQEAVEAAQERLAQMVAKQFVEIRTDIQDVQQSLHKFGNRQAQVGADLGDVSRTCEFLKRRLQDLHTDLNRGAGGLQAREFTVRLDHLEREVAEIRQRLSSAI